MEKQATEESVVCDHWNWPESSDFDFFRRLFGERPFQFELGLKRTKRDWFHLPKNQEIAVLRDRASLICGNHPGSVFWTPLADPVFSELTERFGSIQPSSTGAIAAAELSQRWPPDFILLHRDGNGEFRMVGGAVCFPSGWAPEEKLGLPIGQIHEPVPTLNRMLGDRIQSFLGRLPSQDSFDRLNWGLAPQAERNRHPLTQVASFTSDFPLEKAWLRVEHQSFHALPRTNGIAFLIHLTIHSVGQLLGDREITSGLLRQLQSMSEEVARYKGLAKVRESWVRWLIFHQDSLNQSVKGSESPFDTIHLTTDRDKNAD